ncbi:hypothetical protein GGU10DRAFT_334273 [Lentinula aff. detonsa]|uniref:Uncharacterized protein n=1 Tax=Lentinula aff. detonsa TaxID=2804958 RepID=A0AA38NPB6_9AGAR|nr:hypothetical protein GGU10DRAFT_334273 [Lentinula aff. detonsa]
MLFTVTTSRLFTLLYLFVSILTASGSPLPPATRFGPEPPPGLRRKSAWELKLKSVVQLGYCERDANPTHALLAIDDRILHAVWSDDSRTQLQPKEVKEDDELFYHLRCNWVTLGKAKFGSSADKDQALEALLSITMPLHKATGGKCWDYIELVLETMNKRKELVDFASILATFKVVQEKFRTRS